MKKALKEIADCIIGIALDDLTTAERKIYYILARQGIVYIDKSEDAVVIKGDKYPKK